jgi:iron(III) transport system ATP-binding protein
VREDIRSLQQQLSLTAVYVTHDQEEALAVSDRIIVMRNARIVQDGTPRRLYEEPADRFIADFIGNANLLPVVAERADAGTARIRLQGVTLTLPSRRRSGCGPAAPRRTSSAAPFARRSISAVISNTKWRSPGWTRTSW